MTTEFEVPARAIGARAGQDASKVATAYLAGTVTLAQAVTLLVRITLFYRVQGVALGAWWAGQVAPPVGAPVGGPGAAGELAARLSDAFALTLGRDDPGPTTVRVASNEPVQAAQETVQEVAAENGYRSYTRGLDADPCELCQWLWKDGYRYPIDQNMHKHPGCACVPIPSRDEPGRHAGGKR